MKTSLPYFKKAASLLILMLFMSFVQKSFGQTAASETWALTSNNNTGTPTGNIIANAASSGSGISASNNGTYGLNATGWSTSSSSPGTSDYFQYSIAPSTGYSLTVSGISFVETTNTTTSLKYMVNYYVTNAALPSDNTFYSSSTNFYNGTVSTATNGSTITLTPSVTVPAGYSIYIRIYAYDVNNGSTTIFGNRTFKISGTTAAPTIGTPTLGSTSACVTGSAQSANINVSFSTTGSFNSGNTFTAQLLNSSGAIINSNIGSASASPITANIPANTASASYKINVVSSNPVITSAASSAITVTKYSINTIAPGSESYTAGGSGAQLTVTESTPASARLWYYAKQAGGPYTSLGAANTSTTYTPSGINGNLAGTYYVVCISTFGTCLIKDTSSEVAVTVAPGAITNITTNPQTLSTQKVGTYFPAITVTGNDLYGNVINAASTPITISYSVAGATITPANTNLVNGTTTLTNIEVNQPGNNVTVTFALTSNSAIKGIVTASSVSAFATAATDNFRTNNLANSTGEWSTVGNWQNTHDAGNTWYTATSAPTNAASSINIQNGYTVTVTSGSVTGGSMTIAAGGEMDINSGGTLTIKDGSANALANAGIVKVNSGGTLINQGTFTNTGSVSINANGTYNHALNSGSIPTINWDVASTCIVSGVTSTAPSGLGQAFGNFTWSSSMSGDYVDLNSTLKTINGNFTFSTPGNTNSLRLATDNALTLVIKGNFLISGGGILRLTDGASSPIINVTGGLSLTNGSTLDFSAGTNGFFGGSNGSGIINLSGNYFESGSSDRLVSGFGGNGTINFSGTAQSVSSALTSGADASNVDFVIKNLSIVTLATNFPINNSAENFGNSSTFTVASGGTLICGSNILSGIGSNYTTSTFSLQSGGNLQIASGTGITTAGTGSGSIQTNVRSFVGGGNYIYNGALAQSTGSGLPTTITGSLTIDNRVGAVTLYQATTISNGVLYLTNGLFTTSASTLIKLTGTASVTMADPTYTTTSYVNGPLQRTGAGSFTFPVGKSGVGYVPIAVAPTTSQTFTGEYFHANALSVGSTFVSGTNLKRVSSCDYWKLDLGTTYPATSNSTLGSGTANVTVYWNPNNSCNVITDLATLAIGHYSFANGWDVIGSGTYQPATGTTTNGSLTYVGVQTFSPFALGSLSSTANPLPITLDYFTATKQVGYNKLTWKVECTSSSSSFDVERSYDGVSFEAINTVKVTSATDCATPFVYNDYNSNGSKVYYRIKMVDVDDNAKYSNVEMIANSENVIELMSIQPNPVYDNGSLKISASTSQNIELAIIAIDGKQIQHKTIQVQQGTNTVQLNTGALVKGIYFVKGIFANGQTNVIKFIKQ